MDFSCYMFNDVYWRRKSSTLSDFLTTETDRVPLTKEPYTQKERYGFHEDVSIVS